MLEPDMINGFTKNIFMDFKKWMLVLVLILGLASCSGDGQEGENSPEVVYADVKPNQTKYKAYYGQKLTKNTSVASRSAETSTNGEVSKPVSVIFYPRTQTISFSNIFDNKTVEYKVTAIGTIPGVKVVYNFKINETTFTCTITEKTATTTANVVITFAGGFYKFDITDFAKKNIAKLLSKTITTQPSSPDQSYIVNYIYSDTVLVQTVRYHVDPSSYQTVVGIVDYSYEAGKLISRITRKGDGSISNTSTFEYENNLITKETVVYATNSKRNIKYEYDNQGRISAIYTFFNAGTNYSVRFHTYEKNKMTTIYTDSTDSYYDTEISVYNSDRKPYLISQDQILEPFVLLDITKSSSTSRDGQFTDFGDFYFEYSPDGFPTKRTDISNGETLSTKVFEYVEE